MVEIGSEEGVKFSLFACFLNSLFYFLIFLEIERFLRLLLRIKKNKEFLNHGSKQFYD